VCRPPPPALVLQQSKEAVVDEAVLLLQARKQLLHSSPRSVTRISRSRLAQRCRRSLALGWHCHPWFSRRSGWFGNHQPTRRS
jgi:hypothetical protein